MRKNSSPIFLMCIAIFLYLGLVSTGFASSSGPKMPWDGPLEILARALTSRTSRTLAVVGIVGAAVSLMFFEVGRALRWFLAVIFSASVAAAAFNILSLFQIVSAVV